MKNAQSVLLAFTILHKYLIDLLKDKLKVGNSVSRLCNLISVQANVLRFTTLIVSVDPPRESLTPEIEGKLWHKVHV